MPKKKCGSKTDKKTSTKTASKTKQNNNAKEMEKLQGEITRLEEELEESKQIMTKAQQDYINLKMDFDHIQQRMQKQQTDGKIELLCDVVSKFLPFIENLRKSIDNIPPSEQDKDLAKGVVMTYKNFLKTLESMHIFKIDAVGQAPDTELHEPISQIPAPKKEDKGKVVQEFATGFVYRKDDVQKVICPAKVVVGM